MFSRCGDCVGGGGVGGWDNSVPFLALATCGMLRWCFFSGLWQHAGCYVGASLLRCCNMRDVALVLLFFVVATCGMLRSNTVAHSSLANCEGKEDQDKARLLELSKLTSCGLGAKASYAVV